MSLVVFDKVSLSFGPKEILRETSFRVAEGDRIGLVGINGTGKSTLLRLIAGEMNPDSGDIIKARSVRLGYLPQEITQFGDLQLLPSVLSAAPGKEQIDRRLARAEEELEECGSDEERSALAQTLYDLHMELSHFEALYAPHEAEKLLEGLGFRESDFERPLGEFSGGWRMRAALAGLLFAKPDLLLLDEPTNHLDVPSLAWFEEYLRAFKHAFILISHDREFLDRQIARVLSFEVEGVRAYGGNFATYLTQRELEEDLLEARAENQQREIDQSMRFITRFRAKSTKAKQVQSRLRKLEKMETIVTPKDRKTLTFRFPSTTNSGRVAVKIEGLSKSFGAHQIFNGLDAEVLRGERVAIIGRNGCGKTTLLRIIAGEIEHNEGQVELGYNVELGYYAQHHSAELTGDASVLQEVWSISPNLMLTHVRNICGLFLFSGDEVEKSCSVLSGGEKARVALAKLLLRPGNLLLMDEPTNHLDIYSSEALAEALATFDGTLVFVSHNHAFINRLATKIWDLDTGKLEIYPGNLREYQEHLRLRKENAEAEAQAAAAAAKAASSPAPAVRKPDRKEARRVSAEKTIERSRVLRPLKARVSEMEERIGRLEKEQAELTRQLADVEFYSDTEKLHEASSRFGRNQTKLDELIARWEFAQGQLNEAEGRFKP